MEFCNNKKDIRFVKRSKDNSDYICEDLNCNKNYQSNEDALNKNNNQINFSNSNGIPTDINDEMDRMEEEGIIFGIICPECMTDCA